MRGVLGISDCLLPRGDAMSEMVERVARAICEAKSRVNECGPKACQPLCPWCVASARAAIEAMREPTQAMHRAGLEAPQTVAEIWRAMIEEATK